MGDPLLLWAASLAALYIVAYIWLAWSTGHLGSPSSLYAALVAMHFAIPGVVLGMTPDFVYNPNAEFAAEAMLFALASLLAFHAGGLLVSPGRLRTGPRRQAVSEVFWSRYRVLVCVAVLLLIGWAIRVHVVNSEGYFQVSRTRQGELEGPFYAAIRMAEEFPMYALCILAIVCWRRTISWARPPWLLLTTVVVGEIVYWLPSGRKEPLVLVVVLPLLIRYLRRQRLPSTRTFLSLVAVAALLFPVSYVYRNAMALDGTDGGLIDTVVTAATVAETGVVVSDKTTGEILFGRLSLLEPLSACIRLSRDGGWRPMLGSSYAQALLSFVPRAIWPGKPDFHYGTEFGHASGLLSASDWFTSISVTFFGEAFLNFAWGGLLPMFLMGATFGWLYRRIAVAADRETWLLVYLVAIPTILYIGGTFALHFGGLIKLLPLFYAIGWLLRRRPAFRPVGAMTPQPPVAIG